MRKKEKRLVRRDAASIPQHIIMIAFSIACVVPLLLIAGISLTEEMEIYTTGYKFIPEKISFEAYDYIMRTPKTLLQAYGVTITVTVVGTLLSLFITGMLGYVMSRKDFFLAKPISFMVFFAMIFSGGVVPWYIVCTKILHLKNTFAGLILPYAVVPWFVLLMKGFFTSVPREIIESAKIDGCGDIRAFFSVVVPISVPALTTVGLFIALNYWNDYKLALYFVQDADMYPLQYMLQQMMSNLNFMRTSMAASHGINLNTKLPSESVRMGMCLLAAGPMLVVFPFFQKYFVKGLTVGAVKG